MDMNFQPTVKCPFCKKTNRPPVSGWGGELSSRTHNCKFCHKDYVVLVYSIGSMDDIVTPTRLNSMRRHIQLIKERIARKQGKLINRAADWADELIRVEQSTGGKQN